MRRILNHVQMKNDGHTTILGITISSTNIFVKLKDPPSVMLIISSLLKLRIFSMKNKPSDPFSYPVHIQVGI